MGKKRKSEKSAEEIRRKIKKLEHQLAEKAQENGGSPPQEEFQSLPPETPYTEALYCESPVVDTLQYGELSPYAESSRFHSTRQPSPFAGSPQPTHQVSPQPVASSHALPQPVPPPPPPEQVTSLPSQPASSLPPQPATSADGNNQESELDDEILQLLGDAPKPETPLGSPIHKDVARRWQDILSKGLDKEVKEKLLKEYLVPSNCDLLVPATLNPEVKAALPDNLVKRDASLAHKQKQLGIALSALGTATELILSNETSKQKLLKPLSDACRILCDTHYSDTKTRRGFVISSTNTKLRDALIQSSRDKFLFGENVSEQLKAAKTIQKFGDALKNSQRPKLQRSNASTNVNNNKNRLNYLPQHRKAEQNKPLDGRRAPNYPQRTSNNTRRPTDRPQSTRTSAPQRR